MKNSFLIIALFFMGGFFASCTVSRGFVSTVKRAEIQQVLQFEPLTFVGIIEKEDKITYNDSLSIISQELFETALSNDKTIPVTGKIVIEDRFSAKKTSSRIRNFSPKRKLSDF